MDSLSQELRRVRRVVWSVFEPGLIRMAERFTWVLVAVSGALPGWWAALVEWLEGVWENVLIFYRWRPWLFWLIWALTVGFAVAVAVFRVYWFALLSMLWLLAEGVL